MANASQGKVTLEELKSLILKQQKQIEDLRSRVKSNEQKVEATGEILDKSATNAEVDIPASTSKTHVGGYGELHYNNLDSKNEIDFHRFVLFFDHEFSDKLRLYSELELEHTMSGEGKPGEVELEQAFIEYDLNDQQNIKAGIFLMPVGLLNETHEPNTFYGVERNPVETNIIPTTWSEGGLVFSGRHASGFSYDIALGSGLSVPTTGGNAYKIRKGRQKVSEANANSGAITGRLKWTGWKGVELATTLVHQNDVTQGAGAAGSESSATLLETHAAIQRGRFGLRALYASWNLNGASAKLIGRDRQTGWYVEPSYKFDSKLGMFARYNEWDNEAGLNTSSKKKQTEIGLNYWLHDDVVLKVDYMDQSGNAKDKGFNLGVGYNF